MWPDFKYIYIYLQTILHEGDGDINMENQKHLFEWLNETEAWPADLISLSFVHLFQREKDLYYDEGYKVDQPF